MSRFITLCPGGWGGNKHPEKILSILYQSDGEDIDHKSHGLCGECKEAVNAQMQTEEDRRKTDGNA